MEQHPVPRNITSFQFKLVGDMTLKQFGYLAAGSIIGYALLKLLPLPFIINLTFGGLIFFIGFAFAFLPYQDRPLDQWLSAFIKSVYSPTQFIYLKQNQPPDILLQSSNYPLKRIDNRHQQNLSDAKKMLEAYLTKLPPKPEDSFDQNEKLIISQTLALFTQTTPTIPTTNPKTTPPPKESQLKKSVSPLILEAKKPKNEPPPIHFVPPSSQNKENTKIEENLKTKQLTEELLRLKQQAQQNVKTKITDPLLEKRFLELEQKLTALLTEREKLTAEIAKLKQNPNFAKQTVIPQLVTEEPSQPTVKIISQKQATKVGILNPPTIPNLVIGVIKDNNDIALPNILITVKDMRANPLRALKTNKLGQFFASTPLPNGDYVLEIEDPMKRYSFDLVQIKLTGEVIQPLEIIAKKRIDPIREKLTKELFQKTFS